MTTDISTIAAWSAGIGSIVSAVLTVLFVKGAPALLRYKRAGLDTKKYEDKRVEDANQKLYETFQSRLGTLEERYQKLSDDHVKCIEQQVELRVENKHLREDLIRLESELKGVRQRLHDMAGAEHAIVMRAAAEKAVATTGVIDP